MEEEMKRCVNADLKNILKKLQYKDIQYMNLFQLLMVVILFFYLLKQNS